MFSSRLSFVPIVLLVIGFTTIPASSHAAAPASPGSYQVASKLHVDGPTRWDYLTIDPQAKRLYLTHLDQVDVFDTVGKTMVGHIPDTHGVHGVALAPSLDRGFTSNGKDNTVTVFAMSTSAVLATVPTEKNPDAIVFDPTSNRVFAANGGSNSLTAIDARNNSALRSIQLGGRPEFAAVDGKGRLFINLEDKNSLVVVDTNLLTIAHRYDLSAACDEPAGLSIDTKRQVLFVGCHNRKMVVVDTNTGKVIDAVPIGDGSDATAFDESAENAFSSNGDGTLTVVARGNDGHYSVLQNVVTMRGARTMAVDPTTHAVYLVAAEIDHIDSPTASNPRPRPKLKPESMTLITVVPDGSVH